MSPKIVLVVSDQESNAQIKDLGVALLELRIDLFKQLDLPYILRQIKHRKLLNIPLLMTVRNQKNEGALKNIPDKIKLAIITANLALVDMIDIELSSPLLNAVVSLAQKHQKKIIVSSHYLKNTPSNLESIFKKAHDAGADIVKIAAFAKNFDDVMNLLNFTYRHKRQPLITMSLGPIGSISRLIFPAVGSRYTYSFLQKPSAAGQVGIKTLQAHIKAYYPNVHE